MILCRRPLPSLPPGSDVDAGALPRRAVQTPRRYPSRLRHRWLTSTVVLGRHVQVITGDAGRLLAALLAGDGSLVHAALVDLGDEGTTQTLMALLAGGAHCRVVLTPLLRAELLTEPNPALVLRKNTDAARILSLHTRAMGRPFLWAVLAPVLRLVLNSPGFELDVQKQPALTADQLQQHAATLMGLVNCLFDLIARHANLLPPCVLDLLAMTFTEVDRAFPTHGAKGVSRLLFLRLICPALVSPSAYGLVAQAPSPAHARVLVLLSKVLQAICNGSRAEQQDNVLLLLSDGIDDGVPWLVEFCGRVGGARIASVLASHRAAQHSALSALWHCTQCSHVNLRSEATCARCRCPPLPVGVQHVALEDLDAWMEKMASRLTSSLVVFKPAIERQFEGAPLVHENLVFSRKELLWGGLADFTNCGCDAMFGQPGNVECLDCFEQLLLSDDLCLLVDIMGLDDSATFSLRAHNCVLLACSRGCGLELVRQFVSRRRIEPSFFRTLHDARLCDINAAAQCTQVVAAYVKTTCRALLRATIRETLLAAVTLASDGGASTLAQWLVLLPRHSSLVARCQRLVADYARALQAHSPLRVMVQILAAAVGGCADVRLAAVRQLLAPALARAVVYPAEYGLMRLDPPSDERSHGLRCILAMFVEHAIAGRDFTLPVLMDASTALRESVVVAGTALEGLLATKIAAIAIGSSPNSNPLSPPTGCAVATSCALTLRDGASGAAATPLTPEAIIITAPVRVEEPCAVFMSSTLTPCTESSLSLSSSLSSSLPSAGLATSRLPLLPPSPFSRSPSGGSAASCSAPEPTDTCASSDPLIPLSVSGEVARWEHRGVAGRPARLSSWCNHRVEVLKAVRTTSFRNFMELSTLATGSVHRETVAYALTDRLGAVLATIAQGPLVKSSSSCGNESGSESSSRASTCPSPLPPSAPTETFSCDIFLPNPELDVYVQQTLQPNVDAQSIGESSSVFYADLNSSA